MANLLITYHCGRNCRFCFAKKRLSLAKKEETETNISIENFRKVMDFMVRSGTRQLKLLGGEPTCHPEFVNMVEEALGREFQIVLFTNGMMPAETADFLGRIPSDKLGILCNISPQAEISAKQKEKVDYFLERNGEKVRLGITITEPEFDYGFLIDHILEKKLMKRVRVGIAQPIVDEDNEFLEPSRYREAGRSIVRMVQECDKQDILVGFDCGLTLCMFDDEEIGILARCSEGFKAVCRPIIDIGPNLDIWHCFPMSEILNSRLDKFEIREDAVRYYSRLVNPYRILGILPDCLECKYLKRGQCTGGCLAHAINAARPLPPRYAKD
jgi:MoaA/NifB/PqqE/SkfB family radical SAM enzyme